MSSRAIHLIIVILITFSATTSASGALFERSHALVIGIGRYPDDAWPALSYARKDAEGMATFLREQGFEVTELFDEDATRANIINEPRRICRRLASLRRWSHDKDIDPIFF